MSNWACCRAALLPEECGASLHVWPRSARRLMEGGGRSRKQLALRAASLLELCLLCEAQRALLPQVARRAGVWCHVDACLGGFVLPFARQLGHAVPAFDFAVPGVSSMSVDTHKFGMAHKARASRGAAQCCLLCGGVWASPCKA